MDPLDVFYRILDGGHWLSSITNFKPPRPENTLQISLSSRLLQGKRVIDCFTILEVQGHVHPGLSISSLERPRHFHKDDPAAPIAVAVRIPDVASCGCRDSNYQAHKARAEKGIEKKSNTTKKHRNQKASPHRDRQCIKEEAAEF